MKNIMMVVVSTSISKVSSPHSRLLGLAVLSGYNDEENHDNGGTDGGDGMVMIVVEYR